MLPGIADARAYREKVESDLAAFLDREDDPSLAINAWTFAYHLYEWLWSDKLKAMKPARVRNETLRTKDDFVGWLSKYCPHFDLVQSLTNGSKHAFHVAGGGPIRGWGGGRWSEGAYGTSYLRIDLGETAGDGCSLVASNVVKEMAGFMIDLAKELGA